ncbi:putative metal chaperone YciC [Andreesenia angusta]|uniref:Putative metal chaperone YciC n=1 Tax=Andreesenia angusta TaxID=39480 RepID=A0A1S1V8P6_9FIRM|nr:GTP-binding protein [Andreesenia angusta]OHW62874.1 putative metal chaperone YciC [Andreesenia angusta]
MSIDITVVSGFLGAGKTTFLKKVISGMQGKGALIENEFGDIGIDGDMFGDELPVREIYAGCICCSVVHDFKKTLEELVSSYSLDYILIEPSGVASLSDIIKICDIVSKSSKADISLKRLITIVDVKGFEDYISDFGGFFLDQIENANVILLSHFEEGDDEKVESVVSRIKSYNEKALIFKENWYRIEGGEILYSIDSAESEGYALEETEKSNPANRTFETYSARNTKSFSEEEIEELLISLKSKEYGHVLRAKGILTTDRGKYVNFNFSQYSSSWSYVGICEESKAVVIGQDLNREKMSKLFE